MLTVVPVMWIIRRVLDSNFRSQVFEILNSDGSYELVHARELLIVAISETELLALAVDDAERRSGVGAALVEAFIRTSRGAGSSSARVVVGATNHRAIALYGRAGFRESTKLQVHSGADSLVMRVGLQATSL